MGKKRKNKIKRMNIFFNLWMIRIRTENLKCKIESRETIYLMRQKKKKVMPIIIEGTDKNIRRLNWRLR